MPYDRQSTEMAERLLSALCVGRQCPGSRQNIHFAAPDLF